MSREERIAYKEMAKMNDAASASLIAEKAARVEYWTKKAEKAETKVARVLYQVYARDGRAIKVSIPAREGK